MKEGCRRKKKTKKKKKKKRISFITMMGVFFKVYFMLSTLQVTPNIAIPKTRIIITLIIITIIIAQKFCFQTCQIDLYEKFQQ